MHFDICTFVLDFHKEHSERTEEYERRGNEENIIVCVHLRFQFYQSDIFLDINGVDAMHRAVAVDRQDIGADSIG